MKGLLPPGDLSSANGGVGDQGVTRRRGAASLLAPEPDREWVVAAGIEHDELHALGTHRGGIEMLEVHAWASASSGPLRSALTGNK